MLTIVGVGHVFDISAGVRRAILDARPALVAVELDKTRYMALRSGDRGGGKAPMAYQMLAAFQRRVADKYQTTVGGEMISAIESAREVGAEVAFIDMDASQVFLKWWRSLNPLDKVKLFGAALAGMFVRKERIDREIQEFQEHEAEYMEVFAREFPAARKYLIDDRNRHMARALRGLGERYGDIVAVVGDGHVEGMRELLSDMEPRVIRMRELQGLEGPKTPENYTLTDSYDYS